MFELKEFLPKKIGRQIFCRKTFGRKIFGRKNFGRKNFGRKFLAEKFWPRRKWWPRRPQIFCVDVQELSGGEKKHGRTMRPNGRTMRPNGRTVRPNGRTVRPNGRTVRPNGRTMRPNGRTMRPNGRPRKITNLLVHKSTSRRRYVLHGTCEECSHGCIGTFQIVVSNLSYERLYFVPYATD